MIRPFGRRQSLLEGHSEADKAASAISALQTDYTSSTVLKTRVPVYCAKAKVYPMTYTLFVLSNHSEHTTPQHPSVGTRECKHSCADSVDQPKLLVTFLTFSV